MLRAMNMISLKSFISTGDIQLFQSVMILLDTLNDVIPNITQLTCGIIVVVFINCRSIAVIN